MSIPRAAILGCAGPDLLADERAFFRDADPLGFILFARNVDTPERTLRLVDALRASVARADAPVLIDQEGGRVARMQPPEWPAFPAGAAFDALYDVAPVSAMEAARANAHAMALMLSEVGVNVDALPLLDVRQPDGTPAIGDRALGSEPMRVAALGKAVIEGLRRGGVVGIVKHMPGHGRAKVDSHLELPRVSASAEELAIDIEPFERLKDAPMAMTCHLAFDAWDPERPATFSPTVIEEIIRTRIGFGGLLMTDDIDMKALSGTPGEKAALAIAAGCDVVLDCWARMDEMVEIAGRLGDASPATLDRLERAMATVAGARDDAGYDDLIAKRDALLALV